MVHFSAHFEVECSKIFRIFKVFLNFSNLLKEDGVLNIIINILFAKCFENGFPKNLTLHPILIGGTRPFVPPAQIWYWGARAPLCPQSHRPCLAFELGAAESGGPRIRGHRTTQYMIKYTFWFLWNIRWQIFRKKLQYLYYFYWKKMKNAKILTENYFLFLNEDAVSNIGWNFGQHDHQKFMRGQRDVSGEPERRGPQAWKCYKMENK